MTLNPPPVCVDSPSSSVLRITLFRPGRMNAIDGAVLDQLGETLRKAASEADVRAVILAGAGSDFSAGGDIKFLRKLDPQAFGEFHANVLGLLELLITFPKPLVAAVQGAVTGGAMGIALACDYVVAAQSARFIAPFLRIGLTPDMGLAYSLARRIGHQAARRFILDDEPLGSAEALRLGVADRLLPDEALADGSIGLASRLAAMPPIGLRQTRWLIEKVDGELARYLAAEATAARPCLGSPEFEEGVAAFLGKRKPVWPNQAT